MFGRKQDRLSPAREPEEFFEPAGARRKGWVRWLMPLFILLLVTAGSVIAAMTLRNVSNSVESTGAKVGDAAGGMVGTAIGSFKGVTVGLSEGWETGKDEALTNPETTSEIQNVVRQTGRLEVLQANVKLTNRATLGKNSEILEAFLGNAVFTVDFADATIFQSGSTIYIYIPEPELDLYLDYTKSEKIAQIEKFDFTVGKQEGAKEYLSSLAKIRSNVKEEISNYDTLVELARTSAQSQISQLVYTICGSDRPVNVQFR